MGFKLSSFLAGATRGAVEVLEEDQARAEKSAAFGVKSMKENYDKVMAENRTLENEVSKNINVLRTFDNTATEAELFAAATNSAFMSMAVDAAKTNPAGFKLSKFVKIKEENASPLTAMERLKEHTSLMAAEKAAPEETKSSGNFIADLRGRVSDKAARKAEEQTAKAMGVSIEQLRAASGYKRPEIDAGAEINMAGFQKQPENTKEIKDKLEVAVIQAAQQFGENSPEYIDAKKKVDTVNKEINRLEGVVDKNQEARAERLMLERLDTKDPARIAEIDASLKDTRASILNHKKLTTLKDPKDKEATYREMKTSVSDYVTTRMKEDRGFDWNKYVDFKTFTDPDTDTTITSRTQKAGLTIEQQRELFAKERQLTAQALKANGYVLQDGTPRTPVAQQLMTNFNISANELAAKETPTEKPLPMANAAPTTPAPAQPAAPATRPVPQLTREDQDALVWANNPANAGPKADAIKKKIQNKINGAN